MTLDTSLILTVAFVIAITSFFKTQLGLKGWWVILAAFVVLLVLLYIPLLIVQFPVAASYLDALWKVIVLLLTAAGSVDFVKEIRSG
jgi:hypothetical protein